MKTYVFTAHISHFNAFRARLASTQPRQARALVHIKTEADMRMNHKYPTVLVGPYWTHPDWESRFLPIILERCQGRPTVALQWFPMSL